MFKRVGKAISRYFYIKFKRYALWPTWRLLFTALLFLIIGVLLLRSNNQTALNKYQDVLKADQFGGAVYEKLEELQDYTFSHMNSNLDQPVQLVYTYNRDADQVFREAQARLNSSGSVESRDIYLEAQKECESRGIPITTRAQCVSDYVLSNNPEFNQDQLEVDLPDKSLYSFEFSSPRWTWDGAGIALFLSLIFFLGAIFRTLLAWFLRRRWTSWENKYLRG